MALLTRLAVSWISLQAIGVATAQTLPTVDLGYNIQQATQYYQPYDAYGFLDVRYAAAPVGPNRFRAPQPPVVNRTAVQQGGQKVYCGQAVLGSSGQTEDCLFLDLYTPRTAFNNAGNFSGLPVIVWIYGGAYQSGSKQDQGPAGFFAREMAMNASGIVFVAMNYRLGALGWLGGPQFSQNGDPNAGLLDQRFALDWVKTNVAKFGGDPNRVTVMGESAGGGSIMYQLTAYGGANGSVPFIRILPQSPGYRPVDDTPRMNAVFQRYLQLLNVSTIDQARTLSFDAVHNASTKQIGLTANYNGPWGPVVDGKFVPDLPGKLLLNGQFDKNVAYMIGHNVDEGRGFTDPNIQTDADFRTFVNLTLPLQVATPSNINYVATSMYPQIFDGSQAQNYTTQFTRGDAYISELFFTCNTFWLNKAANNQSYAYYFAVPPATHGADLNYTFYPGGQSSDPKVQLALMMQSYFLNFVTNGNPNGANLPNFPQYGPSATLRVFNTTGSPTIADPAANTRCNIFQTAL